MEKYIYALGFFDGVHLGHRALLDACRALAAENGCLPAAVTFARHPQAMFTSTPPKLIGTRDDRVRLLKKYGMAEVTVLAVDEKTMRTPWRAFLDEMCARGAVGFVCGDDFRFGARGEGNAEALRAFCAERDLPCAVIAQRELDGARICSTRIRAALEAGDLTQAERLLGHAYTLTGTVVQGKHIGRTIGAPTANLRISQETLLPAFGVYACRAHVDGKTYAAVTNIGVRPTVCGEDATVEPWLLDFAGDLYGKTLTLEFYAYLRAEKKFTDLTALQTQIHLDAAQARALLAKNERID